MEKTFEELIEETPLYELLSIPEMDLVKILLQQVREATIEECFDIAIDEDISNARIMSLPTDRIYQFENKRE